MVTEHRCPCRTMGPRPLLTVAEAEASLVDSAGRLQGDARAPERMPLTAGRQVPFSLYAAEESRLIDRLLRGEPPPRVLDAIAFPVVTGAKWTDIAHIFRSRIDSTACSYALASFGDVLLRRSGAELRSGVRASPALTAWQASFDRAEARSPAGALDGSADAIFADWLADALFGLDWPDRATFASVRCDLATRYSVACSLAAALGREGKRADRAAAEAVTIVELAGAAPLWRQYVGSFDPSSRTELSSEA